MAISWETWEGRTVDRFVLGKYLGGSEESAVFRARVAEGDPAEAAIRFVVVDPADAERQLERWKQTAELTHPNLIRIFRTGKCSVEGREFVDVVEEFAEENLGQIIPERALTAEEVRGMLGPLLSVLQYVHGKGLVHGSIRPSNILAVGDQVKVSADGLRQAGELPRSESVYDAPEAGNGISAAGDIWSLGMTLVEALTQHVPVWDPARMNAPKVGQDIPEPFRAIARRCLEVDPQRRCGFEEIRDRLEGRATSGKLEPIEGSVTAGAIRSAGKFTEIWQRWLVPAVVLALVIFLIARPWVSKSPNRAETSTSQPTTAQPVVTPQPQQNGSAGETAPKSADREAQGGKSNGVASNDEVLTRVMPDVLPSARRTIQGKIKVRVQVDVDANGNVTEARLKDAGPSKYFARVSVEAARRWKFTPARDEKRQWTLMFAYTRARTEAEAKAREK